MLPTRSIYPYFRAFSSLVVHFDLSAGGPDRVSQASLQAVSSAVVAVSAAGDSILPTATPPKTEVTNAAIGRITANAGPKSDQVAAMLSTPVCGVAIRNEVEDALDAPLRRIAMAVGSTPHEHKGRGTPIKADFTTGRQPVPARWRARVFCGIKACISPAMRNPNRMYGDISLSIKSRELSNSIIEL